MSDLENNLNKIAHESGFVGQSGINFIATVVGKMRHLWTPTPAQSDVGIDGYIEICREGDGDQRVPTNFIIQVQSKASDVQWAHEDLTGFVHRVDGRDLQHWLNGNCPVILVVSRPRTDEAYWVSIKDYFSSLEAKKTRTIYFKKALHRFDENIDFALQRLAIPSSVGLQLEVSQKQELLLGNLLPLVSSPNSIFTAKTRYRSFKSVYAKAKQLGGSLGREWFLKNGMVISFRPLDEDPWVNLLQSKAINVVSTSTYAESRDPEKLRDFVRLMNLCLTTFLEVRGLKRFKLAATKSLYYFVPNSKEIERRHTWGDRGSDRRVIQKIMAKGDPRRIICYRHHALIPSFESYGGKWFLVIEPTYHFTFDGEKEYTLRAEYLSGIKRIEKHQAVSNNTKFWGYFLTYSDMFDQRKELLSFGSQLEFSCDDGIADDVWLSQADDEEREQLGAATQDSSREIVAEGNQLSLL